MNGETTETKKCVNCLRRIEISYYLCPYCKSTDFIYDT
jgi:RNA polymerase subunit RPABC4/transcription elongation factor Spt4